MNKDILQGNWKQMQGQVKKWWGHLTDDDITEINGNREMLIGRLQERYGWSHERAMEEVDQHFRETGRRY